MFIVLAANWIKGNTGDFVYHSLTRMGHDILLISPYETPYDNSVTVPQDVGIAKFVKNLDARPDLFLHVDCSAAKWFFPEGIETLGIPTAFWSTDSHFNFRWHKEWAGLFDYSFFTQLDWLRLAEKAGVDNATWLPYAADEVFHRDSRISRDIDVGYVGSINRQKEKYFKMLENGGVKVVFNDRRLTYEEIGDFYSRCKIVYNIAARYDINQRIFEGPCAGALLISQKRVDSGFYEIFTPGVNAAVHDFDDAAMIINDYLADPEKLQRVASEGQKLVLEKHTYKARMNEIIRVCRNGVAPGRMDRKRQCIAHIKSAFVYQHPSFRLRQKAFSETAKALRCSLTATVLHALKYALFRLIEKVIKTRQKFGKAPY